MTFAELKKLKQQQQQQQQQHQQQQQQQQVPRSPRSLQSYDARPLSPRPTREEEVEETESAELQEQLAAAQAELERVRKKLANVEANGAAEEDKLKALRAEVAAARKSESALDADVKYAQLELQFDKERVAKTNQQREKQLMVRRGAEGGLVEEAKVLTEQLAEEAARGKTLMAEREAATELAFKLEQAVEREKAAVAAARARSQLLQPAAQPESEDVKHYRSQLEKEKERLASETQKIALLTVALEGEIRTNRAQIDEAEADFLRQIAKLKSVLQVQ